MHIIKRLESPNGLVDELYDAALAHIGVLEVSVAAQYQNVSMRAELRRGKVHTDFHYMASYIRQLEAIISAEATRKLKDAPS